MIAKAAAPVHILIEAGGAKVVYKQHCKLRGGKKGKRSKEKEARVSPQ